MDFDLSAGYMLASLVASSIGFGVFRYGKAQGRGPQVLAGVVMMISPSVVHSPTTIMVTCGALLGGLYLASRRG